MHNKKILFFNALILIISLIWLLNPAFSEISGTQDFSITSYHVEGNTDNSFYPRSDIDYLYEGTIDFKNLLDDREIFGSIQYRATDDRLVDSQDASLEKFFIGMKKEAFEILAGDFYANFSEYSLGNALKGSKLFLGEKEGNYLTVVGGIDTARWEDFWETRCENTATRKYVWGFQLGNNILLKKKLDIRLNYGGSFDDAAYLSSSSAQELVNVASVDGSYKINNILTTDFETGESFTEEDKRKDEVKTKSDGAYKVGCDLNLKDYSLAADYSRIGPHFKTTGGFAASDLETMALDGIWFLPKNVKFAHYIRRDKNNLGKQLSMTTEQVNPGFKFSFGLPANIDADAGFDLRKRDSSDESVNTATYDYIWGLARDWKVCYSRLGYTRSLIFNHTDSTQERNIDTYSLSLDGSFAVKQVKLSWDLSEDLSQEEYKDVCESDLTLAHGIGLSADFPSTLSMSARATINDNDYYLNNTDNNTTNYIFSISRDKGENLSFEASYERKGYSYADGDNNYAETLLKSAVSYRF